MTQSPAQVLDQLKEQVKGREDGMVATAYKIKKKDNGDLSVEWSHIGDTALFVAIRQGKKLSFERITPEPETFTVLKPDTSLKIEQRHAKNLEKFSETESKMLDDGFGLMHWVRGKNGNANYYLYFKNGDNIETSFSAHQDIRLLGKHQSFTRIIYMPEIKKHFKHSVIAEINAEEVSSLCTSISQSYKDESPIVSYNFTDTLGNNGIFSQNIKNGTFNLSELPQESTAVALVSVSDGINQDQMKSTKFTGNPTPEKIEKELLEISGSIRDDKSINIVPIHACETILHGDGHGKFRGTSDDITTITAQYLNNMTSQMQEVPSVNSVAELALTEESK